MNPNNHHQQQPSNFKTKTDQIRESRKVTYDELRAGSVDGILWFEAKIPSRFHICRAQTTGWIRLYQVQRCSCGAIRHPDISGHWMDKNSRRKSKA